jgi:shikimate dehydrogenase
MSLTGKGKLAGVMGWPIGQSLSPRLHAYWLRVHHVDGAYVPLAVASEKFAAALRGLRDCGFVGVNVTVPHKEAAFALAHELDEAAEAAGAANLLLLRNGRFVGRNTDVEGLAASLVESLGADGLANSAVALIGTGGAARAAVLACDRLGARAIRITGRHSARTDALAHSLKTRVRARLVSVEWSNWSVATADAALIINATSAGMKSNPPLDLPMNSIPANAAVCDLVYNPLETELLKRARMQGLRTIDGLGMLMHQAAPAFEAFYGIRPAVTADLRRELEQALRNGG